MTVDIGLIVDAVVIALLVGFGFQTASLDARLRRMRGALHGFKGLVETFGEKVDRSEALLARLKTSSTDAETALTRRFEAVERLYTDMKVIQAACEQTADRLERGLDSSRPMRPRAVTAGPEEPGTEPATESATGIDKEGDENTPDATVDSVPRPAAHMLLEQLRAAHGGQA